MRNLISFISNPKRAPIFGVIFVVLISFVTYFLSAPRANIGYGDSDEIATVGYLLGVAHPSGYPLVILITKLFTLLPIGTSIVFRAHILAMVTHALAVGFLAMCALELNKFIHPKPSIKSQLIAIFTSLFLTFSAIFWLYGGIIEVGALNNLFASMLIFAVIKWQLTAIRTNTHGSYKLWFLIWGLFGIGLSTVHTFILLLPSVLIAVITTLWSINVRIINKNLLYTKLLPAILVAFFAWLIPNLLLFYLNNNQADMSWVFEQTINGWWRLIARRDYTGVILDQKREVAAYLDLKSIDFYIRGLIAYLGFLFNQITWPVIALTIIGAVTSWKVFPKSIFITIISFFAVSGIMFGTYMGVPEYNSDNLEYRLGVGISHRQYMLGHISFILLTLTGVISLTKLFSNNSKKHKLSSINILGLVVILSIFYQIQSNKDTAVQRNNTLLRDYAHAMLDTAVPNSVVICFSDISCYSLLYEQLVENYRPDVTVLIKNNYYLKYFLINNPQYQGYPYGYNPFFASDLISWNVAHRITYLTEPDGFYSDYMGFDANPFYLIPHGYLYQVATTTPDTLTDNSDLYAISKALLSQKIPSKNYFQSGLKDYFAYKHMTLGFLYSKFGYPKPARYHQETAIKFNPLVSQPRKLLDQVDQYTGDPRYKPGITSPSSQEILAQFQSEFETSKSDHDSQALNQAYQTLLKAVYRDPKSPEARFTLALLYQSGGYVNESKQELEYILKYNPDYLQAQELLKQLNSLPN